MIVAPINLPLSNMTTFSPKFFRVASAPSRRLATKKKTFPGLPRTKSIAQSQTGRTSTLTVARWVSRGRSNAPLNGVLEAWGWPKTGGWHTRPASPSRCAQSVPRRVACFVAIGGAICTFVAMGATTESKPSPTAHNPCLSAHFRALSPHLWRYPVDHPVNTQPGACHPPSDTQKRTTRARLRQHSHRFVRDRGVNLEDTEPPRRGFGVPLFRLGCDVMEGV